MENHTYTKSADGETGWEETDNMFFISKVWQLSGHTKSYMLMSYTNLNTKNNNTSINL